MHAASNKQHMQGPSAKGSVEETWLQNPGMCSGRYHANTSLLLAGVKARLKWAEGAEIKRELDAQVAALLGPKTEADLVKPDKKKAKKVRSLLPCMLHLPGRMQGYGGAAGERCDTA